MQDSASFWTDIKNLEEQLANSPDSFCFARLSEVYLKVGLIDDSLHVARQGVQKHPRYLSGQRAYSLACLAKGLNDEALTSLQLITEALPEDISSQKLLGRLCAEAGNHDAACRAFRTALEFVPEDVECRVELESIERSAGGAKSALEQSEDFEEVIEDLDVLEELDILEEVEPESGFRFEETPPEPDVVEASHHDPLSTATLAELYVSQGFIHKALDIYRAILATNPADLTIADRLLELEALESGSPEPDSEFESFFEEDIEDEPASIIPAEIGTLESGPAAFTEPCGVTTPESQYAPANVSGDESGISEVPLSGTADNASAALEGWLENIRRIKSCQ